MVIIFLPYCWPQLSVSPRHTQLPLHQPVWKYLQGFPCVCFKKMTLLQKPQQSLRSLVQIRGTGEAIHMQEII